LAEACEDSADGAVHSTQPTDPRQREGLSAFDAAAGPETSTDDVQRAHGDIGVVDSGFCTLVSTTQSHCERLTGQDVFIRLDPILFKKK
jgi:hypothetical protein